MRYYYVNGANEPTGPVEQAALEQLRAVGTITNGTAVIREGEPAWRTYADYVPTTNAFPPPPPPPTPGTAGVASGAPIVPGGANGSADTTSRPPVDPTEELVRQRLVAGAAAAGAAARVFGKTAAATARGTARALGDIAQQAEAQTGSSTQVGTTSRLKTIATACFGVALLSLLVIPVLTVTLKGEVQSLRMLGLINAPSGFNVGAVAALLLPIVGMIVVWVTGARWRTPTAIVAALGVASALFGVLGGKGAVRQATMGMVSGDITVGFWLATLALLAAAGIALFGARLGQNRTAQ